MAGVTFPCSDALSQTDEKLIVPLLKADKWGGRPVIDDKHANDMLLGRLYNAPKLGEKAPPSVFVEALTGNAIGLPQLHSRKPVVLLFGSWSCICAQESSPQMKIISEKYKDLVDFALVYIVEAHSEVGFLNPDRGRQFDTISPRDFRERIDKAIRFAREHRFNFPLFVDSMDDTLAVKWGAWPVRLFVIDHDGTVVFAGKQGPWFHKPTRNFDPSLESVPSHLGKIPGFSEESLEEFLETLAKKKTVTIPTQKPFTIKDFQSK